MIQRWHMINGNLSPYIFIHQFNYIKILIKNISVLENIKVINKEHKPNMFYYYYFELKKKKLS
jgi:hypothetical protein